MSTALLVVLGGLLCAAVSAVVTYVMVPRIVAHRLPELLTALAERPPHHDQEYTVPDTRRRPTTSTIIIIALVAVIAVLAVQVRLATVAQQKADRDRDNVVSCLEAYAVQTDEWAQQIVSSLQANRDATKKLRTRTQAWTHRVDGIFQLLIAAHAGTVFSDDTINRVADDYQRASHRLFASYANVQQTIINNPYPTLTLECLKESK